MKYSDKEKIFEDFQSQWGEQFGKIPAILRYISTYPIIAEKLEDFITIDIDELNNFQLEWVSLVAQFNNPIETTFFKDYWVPIQRNSYDYFIDLSSDSLTLFKVDYFCFEPYRWYKKYIFKDLSQFLIDIDKSDFDFENHFKEIEDSGWSEVNSFFEERDTLGFAGKLQIDPIEKDSLFNDGRNSDYSIENNNITFNGVNSVIVGLLPYNCNITLQDFKATYNRNRNVCEEIKSIKALVYLLQSVGLLSIDSYSIIFESDKAYRADFKDNSFKIVHNKEFLKVLIDKYETFRHF